MELLLVPENGLQAAPADRTRILLISERREDYLQIAHVLRAISGQRYELTWCADLALALEAMLSEIHDVILLDYVGQSFGQALPPAEPNNQDAELGRRLLTAANQQGCTAPILVLTAQLDTQLDKEIIKAGASDYLAKSHLETRTLERSIRHALDRKEAELKLARLAHYDALSGVPNRVLFKDRLERAIQRAERAKPGENGVALLFLDFDGFKAVNDTYGHDAGDKLIEMIAERLTACMRKTDSVARLGGDEFTVVLEDVNSRADIINVAKKIIRTVGKPFPIMGHQIIAGCSIGVAQYPDAGADFDTLLKHADSAMYQAKDIEGSAYKFYSDQMDVETLDQNKREEELRDAVNNHEWLLHLQPRVGFDTRKINGVECLLRWQHPQRGLLMPDAFLTLAEETEQLVQIGYWVLHEACQMAAKLADLGYADLSISVNLSLGQLRDPVFEETLVRIVEQSGIDPKRLELEVDEADVMNNLDRCVGLMQSITQFGPGFVLDNFGTGFSSIVELSRLPLKAVKIDRSLIVATPDSTKNQQTILGIISLARNLGLHVIAEGAESRGQVRFLKKSECDSMQGHYFSDAVSFDDLSQLLHAKVSLAV